MKALTEFGSRLVGLHTGAQGIICGLHMTAKKVDGDQPIVSYIASDASVDRYNEVIDQAAWGDFKNFRLNPAITDCHNYSSVAFKLGSAVRYEVKNGRLENDVLFAVANPLGKIAYDMARTGHLPTQSVGFIPEEWENGVGKDVPDRTYKKCDLLEIALTVVPANPNASNLKRAFEAGALEKCDLRELAQWLKQFCSAEADPSTKAGASGAGVHDAQCQAEVRLLQLARGLHDVLKK
jgi:hypothetical protein